MIVGVAARHSAVVHQQAFGFAGSTENRRGGAGATSAGVTSDGSPGANSSCKQDSRRIKKSEPALKTALTLVARVPAGRGRTSSGVAKPSCEPVGRSDLCTSNVK